MLPPNWELTREQISSMNDDDLSQFDVNVFMQSYREKMAKVKLNFKIRPLFFVMINSLI